MPDLEKMPSMSGRVVFQYFYDVGGDVDLDRARKTKLNFIERPRAKGARILAPKYEEAGFQPLVVDLGARKIDGYRATVEGRIFPVGVVGIYINVEFRHSSVDSVIKLAGLDERKVKVAGKEVEFDAVPRELFEEVKGAIKPAIMFPYPPFEAPETYTLILIAESEPRLEAEDFLTRFKKQTAGLLRGEKDWRGLSEKEAEDALKLYLSYSDEDIVIVDWYSALLSGAVDYMDDMVRMIELAKIQLLELRTYDKLLDTRLEQAYDSLRLTFAKPKMGLAWGKGYGELARISSELAEWRIEITDLVEDLRNILKFTGEWYLGRLYRISSERFRIAEWLALVDKKLDRLQELYAISMERVDVHRAMTLEFMVILLIVTIVVLEVIVVLRGI